MPKNKKKNDIFPTIKIIKVGLKNPKSKTRIIFDLFLILIVLGVIGLIVVENSRHNSVKASAEELKALLEAEDIKVSDIQTKCFKPEVSTPFGTVKSKRSCRMSMAAWSESTAEEANKVISATNKAIRATNEYDTSNQELELLFSAPYGSSDYSFGVTQKKKKVTCGLSYKYQGRKGEAINTRHWFKLVLSCDDTSWFGRTFL